MENTTDKAPAQGDRPHSVEAHLIYGQMDDPLWDYSHHLLPPDLVLRYLPAGQRPAWCAGLHGIRAHHG